MTDEYLNKKYFNEEIKIVRKKYFKFGYWIGAICGIILYISVEYFIFNHIP